MTIYQNMQAAVDIVAQSPHPTNKIAATLAGTDASGNDWSISRTNHWPRAIETPLGRETKIGNSSGTIHAETSAILDTPKQGHKTYGAALFITDPPCPNCMKNIAEAGITALYVDHKGFDKDWAKRRGEQFTSMSMRIAEKAGINVYVIHRKEQRFETISSHVPGYKPSIENPPIIEDFSGDFEELIKQSHKELKDEPFALALATDHNGKIFSIQTNCHPTIGYTYETVESKEDKYSFILQPLTRLLMIAARNGLTISPESIYSSRVPTARELVNFIGAGLDHLHIGNAQDARDPHGLNALKQLENAGILKTDILSISS